MKRSNEEKIKYYITYLLSKRDYTESEIKEKVSKKDYYEHDILLSVIDKFKQYNYINDERCAAQLVRSYFNSGYGFNKVKQNAFKKGLNVDILNVYYNEYDFFESCLDYTKKITENKNLDLNDIKIINKLKRKLLSRGFMFDEVNYAIKEIKEITI